MDRREAIMGVALLASGVMAGCRSPAPETIGPDPSATGPKSDDDPAPAPAGDDAVAALRAAVYDCIEAGETCDAHCLRLLSKGDTSMADCARTVSDMLAVMRATSELLASKSPHHVALTKVAIAVCESCEAACKVHSGHHAECKACMEACAKTIAAGKALG